MRIAIILPSHLPVPAVQGGAVETIIQNMIEENEKHHIFDFTVYSSYDSRAYELSRNYKYTNVIYSKVNFKLDDISFGVYRFFKKLFRIPLPDRLSRYKMLKAFNSNQFDYILFQAGEVFCLHRYWKKLNPKKTLVHAHGMITPIKSVDQYFSYYLSISNYVAEYWKSGSNRPLSTYKTWHNCICIDKFDKKCSIEEIQSLRYRLGIDTDDFVVIYTGRIIPEKGVLELLQSIEYLQYHKIKILVIGSAAFEKKTVTSYEKEVREIVLKNKSRVIFTGYIPNSELYKYYHLADVAVVPSLWDEPAGLVVLEAMAAGKPIITTGSGGIREFLNDDCAIYVSRENNISKEIADAIGLLKTDVELRNKMAICAQEQSRKFGMKQYLEELRRIIEEIQGVS